MLNNTHSKLDVVQFGAVMVAGGKTRAETLYDDSILTQRFNYESSRIGAKPEHFEHALTDLFGDKVSVEWTGGTKVFLNVMEDGGDEGTVALDKPRLDALVLKLLEARDLVTLAEGEKQNQAKPRPSPKDMPPDVVDMPSDANGPMMATTQEDPVLFRGPAAPFSNEELRKLMKRGVVQR